MLKLPVPTRSREEMVDVTAALRAAVKENGWIDGIIFFDGHMWKRMDPTFASTGEQSEEIMDFIENGSYTEKYLY